jgi:hypothetical protein
MAQSDVPEYSVRAASTDTFGRRTWTTLHRASKEASISN